MLMSQNFQLSLTHTPTHSYEHMHAKCIVTHHCVLSCGCENVNLDWACHCLWFIPKLYTCTIYSPILLNVLLNKPLCCHNLFWIMAHKAICHVLTHWAGETSLASCLAARDNRLPVPVEGEHRLCCRCCVYMCIPVHVCATDSMSLSACANVRSEEGLCLWELFSSEVPVLSHFFLPPVRVLLNTRNVIWRCCSDPLLLRGGKAFTQARGAPRFWCSGTLQHQVRRACIPRTHDSNSSKQRTPN